MADNISETTDLPESGEHQFKGIARGKFSLVDKDGNTLEVSQAGQAFIIDPHLEISKGNIANHDTLESIGEREAVAVVTGGEDIWRGGTSTIPIPNQITGEQMTVISTSANDTSDGTGARIVHIHYLDNNWAEQTEAITLAGLSEVDTVATNIKFIQSIHVTSIGSNGVAVGDIKIYKKGDNTLVYNIIKAGGNMSLNISRMIPANKTFYLTVWQCSSTAGKPIFVRLRSTDHHGVLYDGGSPIFIFKDSASVQDSTYVRKFNNPIKIPAKSIIKATAWATQAGGNISASWEGILVNN